MSDGWQPIETAPRDGTYILTAQPSGLVLIMQFCSQGYWRSHYVMSHRWTPTHWMPIPKPPVTP